MRARWFPAVVLLALAPPAGAQEGRRLPGGSWDTSPAQERAAAAGLEWLARQQKPGGYWTGDVGYKLQTDYELFQEDAPHVGVTSLALMAFLAGGDLPGRGRHGAVLQKGLGFVLACVKPDGSIESHGTRMYSHAFSTLFLAEVYGTTGDEAVRRALQRATRFIVDAQNDEGGWRYRPKADTSDMSVTVCQVMALRAARNMGINVPWSTIENAVAYVRRSAVSERDIRYFGTAGLGIARGGFKYQIGRDAMEGPHRSSYPLTAAGVTTLLGAGLYDDPLVANGLDYMRAHENTINGRMDHYFFFYGHYYAAQAHFIAGGEWWRNYFQRIREMLLRGQGSDGSWENRVGPGRAFSTAVAVLILQIPYGYLPIFQR